MLCMQWRIKDLRCAAAAAHLYRENMFFGFWVFGRIFFQLPKLCVWKSYPYRTHLDAGARGMLFTKALLSQSSRTFSYP